MSLPWAIPAEKRKRPGRPPLASEPAVRIARADWFTTKGQGFLYVEARTTEGAQTNPIVLMQLLGLMLVGLFPALALWLPANP